MIFNRLTAYIAFQLIMLVSVGMFLVDAVMSAASRHLVVKSELAGAELFIRAIEAHFAHHLDPESSMNSLGEMTRKVAGRSRLTVLHVVGDSGATLHDHYPGDCPISHGEIMRMTRLAAKTGTWETRFEGTTWGVFYKQKRFS